jgi:hypothetical protein
MSTAEPPGEEQEPRETTWAEQVLMIREVLNQRDIPYAILVLRMELMRSTSLGPTAGEITTMTRRRTQAAATRRPRHKWVLSDMTQQIGGSTSRTGEAVIVSRNREPSQSTITAIS